MAANQNKNYSPLDDGGTFYGLIDFVLFLLVFVEDFGGRGFVCLFLVCFFVLFFGVYFFYFLFLLLAVSCCFLNNVVPLLFICP